MILKTIEFTTSTISIRLRAKLTCICPFNTLRDFAVVDITYVPDGLVVDLESFSAYLETFENDAISHEEATSKIRTDLCTALAPASISVTTTWEAVEGVECTIVAAG